MVSLRETGETGVGTCSICRKVKGSSGMDAKTLEYKFYAPGIGLVPGAWCVVRGAWCVVPICGWPSRAWSSQLGPA